MQYLLIGEAGLRQVVREDFLSDPEACPRRGNMEHDKPGWDIADTDPM
jgi:hypothetical protein